MVAEGRGQGAGGRGQGWRLSEGGKGMYLTVGGQGCLRGQVSEGGGRRRVQGVGI